MFPGCFWRHLEQLVITAIYNSAVHFKSKKQVCHVQKQLRQKRLSQFMMTRRTSGLQKIAFLPKRRLWEGDWGRLRWHQWLNAHIATQRADLEGIIFPSISSKSLIPKSRIGHWMTKWGAIPRRTKFMFPMLARDSSQGLQCMFWWDLVMLFVSSKSAQRQTRWRAISWGQIKQGCRCRR